MGYVKGSLVLGGSHCYRVVTNMISFRTVQDTMFTIVADKDQDGVISTLLPAATLDANGADGGRLCGTCVCVCVCVCVCRRGRYRLKENMLVCVCHYVSSAITHQILVEVSLLPQWASSPPPRTASSIQTGPQNYGRPGQP